MIYLLGQVATLTYDLDVNDVATDATVAFTATSPDGVTTPATPQKVATGRWRVDLPLTQIGSWDVRWTASGAATDVQVQRVRVFPARAPIVSAQEVREALNLDTPADDPELASFVAAVSEVVEHVTGPIAPTTVVRRRPYRGRTILLRRPLLSVEAVTYRWAGSTAETLTGWRVDTETGLLHLPAGYLFSPYSEIEVTYTVGRRDVPESIRRAVLDLVRLHWTESQQGTRPGYGDPEDTGDGQEILGFLVPRKVLGWLEPWAGGRL